MSELELLSSSGERAGRHKLSWVRYEELSTGTAQHISVNHLYLCTFDKALSLNKPRNLSGPKVLSYSKILTHVRGLLEKYPTVFFYANT